MAEIHLIVASASNGIIGRNNTMPWHIPADLRHFKQLTTGHTIIMGRNTFESIGKPLPDRTSVVLTSRIDYQPEGCVVVHSLQHALDYVKHEAKAFIIGGASVYRQAMPYAHIIHLTRIHENFSGDTSFPEPNPDEWELVDQEANKANAKNPHAYSFLTYKRRSV